MANIFFIPSGPKNLTALFPDLDWDNIVSYRVQATTGGGALATSPVFKVDCCPEDRVRLHFINSLGGIDAVSFLKPKIIHEDTSDEFQKALPYPTDKTDTGTERFNIKANDTLECRYRCNENDQKWLREIFDSPKIWMEWDGIEGQADNYLPVVKVAGKFDKLKVEQEWVYDFIMQVKLANDYQTQRN